MIVKDKYFQIVDEIIANNFIGKIAVDATVGRGNDTLKLLKAVGDNGFVYGFDIQKEAIDFTREKLLEYRNVKLLNKSHEFIDEVGSCDLIIYNLGYLPRSDKKIVTIKDSTIKSLNKAISIININGIIIVVSYVGHKYSFEERESVEKFLKELDQKKYKVEKREFFNQKNNPPIIYLIERKV